MKHPTQERLKELFCYDEITGIITRKVDTHKGKKGDICGSLSSSGYLQTKIDGVFILNHRIAWLYVYGWLPNQIDHKNTIKTDNWTLNLRPCTNGENSQNSKIRFDNATGVKGVGFNKNAKKYQARITIDGHIRCLGYYKTLKEAKFIIEKARADLHGEFCNHG